MQLESWGPRAVRRRCPTRRADWDLRRLVSVRAHTDSVDTRSDPHTQSLFWGLERPADLDVRVSRLCHPLPADAVLDYSAGASEAVLVWRATSTNKNISDHLPWAVLLDALRRVFESRPPHLREALAAHRMHLGRTLAEINLQLGSRLYHLARQRLGDGTDEPSARQLFESCIAAFDRVEAQGARMPAFAQRGLTGMRGVARVVLSRREDDPVERLSAGVRDLANSEGFGDVSAPHYAFLVEAHLRLFELIADDHLQCAEAALDRAQEEGHRTRPLYLARAETSARRAFLALSDNATGNAVGLFERASELCTEALGLADGDISKPDDLIRARRGQWRFQRALLESDLALRTRLLTAAIDDLRASRLTGVSFPRALLARAEVARTKADWPDVLSDVEEAGAYLQRTGVGDQALEDRVESLASQAATWVGVDTGSGGGALAGVRRLLDLPDSASVSLAAISHGLRAAAPDVSPEELEELCIRFADRARRELDDIGLSVDARRFAASHGAGLLWSVARVRDNMELVRLANGLFRDGIALDDQAAIEMLSSAGSCALRFAKLLSGGSDRERDEARGLLDDARTYKLRALAASEIEGDEASTTHAIMNATLGDILARRYALTHSAADAEEAISALTRARPSAQDPGRVDDLLGQVYYRRGRITRSAQDLHTALEFKHAATEHAPASRENLSICAAAELTMHDLDGDDAHLIAAARYAHNALLSDPTWPWPLFQLAAVARRRRAGESQSKSVQGETAYDLALAGNEGQLLRIAAERAVATTEFREHDLGGRQHPVVLSDPHNLLSQTLVLKATTRANADREWRQAVAMRDFVAAHGEAGMSLPVPLAIIDRPSDPPVYVMRRASGRDLGRLIADYRNGRAAKPLEEVRRALRFLALFHAHSARQNGPLRLWTSGARRQAARDHGRSLVMVGANPDAVADAREAFRAAIPERLPLLAKKDAHPENWLVDAQGAIVMLDLEATSDRPILAEVVQLLEDFPLCDVTESGFEERMELTAEYLAALKRAGVEPGLEDPVRNVYELFALQRAVFGVAFIASVARRATSSSSLREAGTRQEHFSALGRWLSEHSEDPAVRSAAQAAVNAQFS